MPVSMNTYSSLFQSNNAYKPMVFEVDTQMKADNSLDVGSSRKTFMTTPTVLNVARFEKIGGDEGSTWPFPDGSSGNCSFIRTNCIRRSSYDRCNTLAMVKNTVRMSNSTRHFQSSQRSCGSHCAREMSRYTSQHTTLPLFVAHRL